MSGNDSSNPSYVQVAVPDDLLADRTVALVDPLLRAAQGDGADTLAMTRGPDQPALPSRHLVLMSSLGKGSMGEVWVARDTGLGRRVAYKAMLPQHANDSGLITRFFEEVQVTAQLDHPNILPIYSLEPITEGPPAYSMKLVQGKTLKQIFEDAREQAVLPGHDAAARLTAHLDLFLRICDAMAYAHSKGVLHRDLKPENIMVGRFNEVYVMDWGVCRIMTKPEADETVSPSPDQTAYVDISGASSAAERTQHGALVGTPTYMSPEQALGLNGELDGRSDLYTLGLILQELVTLKRARHAIKLSDMVRKAAQGVREPVETLHAHMPLPAELRAIIDKATATQPEDRYGSVSEFADDIRRYSRGEAVLARPDSLIQKMGRMVAQNRRLSLFALVLMALLAISSGLGMNWYYERQRFETEAENHARHEFLAIGSEHQAAIDASLSRYNTALAQFGGRVVQSLMYPPARQEKLYFSSDYDSGNAPGVVPVARYHMPISTQAFAVKLAPGVDVAAVNDSLQAISTLMPSFRNALIRSHGVAPETLDDASTHAMLVDDDPPVYRAALTLDNGVYAYFPGHGKMAQDYDGRQRPKYLLAAHKNGIQWGNPYPDRYGGGLMLPAALSLYDDQHHFLGVVSLDITFQNLIQHVLTSNYPAYVKEVLLLDGEGHVIIREQPGQINAKGPWGDARDLAEASAEAESGKGLSVYEHWSDIRAAGGSDFGSIDVRKNNRYIAYFVLKSLGWTFVTVADREGLFARQ